MPRTVTFGRMPETAPPGTFRRIIFPELARLDEGTNEGWISRVLASDGADSRSLPRTVSFQELDTFGHDMAAPVAAIYEVTIDGEAGIMSGQGWLADDDWGRKAELAILSKKLFHNSIDLAEVTKTSIEEIGNYWEDDYKVILTFLEWKFGKTTIVALPAFADAHGELDSEQLAAALASDEPLIVDCPSHFGSNSALEIVAGMETRPAYSGFHVPEPDVLQSVTVGEPDERGWVPLTGHLADWTRKHKNASGQWVYPPRAKDNYATYCAGKVLTDGGFVKVGPVTLLGGHVSLQDAVEKVENTWADVRVIDGKLGPWMCGYVRPHISADQAAVYVARASQVSGFWPDGQTLRLVSSVNAAGFPVLEPAEDGEFALAASLVVDPGPMPASLKSFREMSDDEQQTVRQWIADAIATGQATDTPVIFKGPAGVLDEIRRTGEVPDGFGLQVVGQEDAELLEQAAIEERARLLAEGPLAELDDE